MKKRLIAILLVFAMLLSIVPGFGAVALAQPVTPATFSLATDPQDIYQDPWDPARVIDPVARATWMDPAQPIEVRVNALLSQMTLEELVGQTTQLTAGNMGTAQIGSGARASRVSNSFLGGFLFEGGGVPPAAFGGNTTEGWLNFYNIIQNEAVNMTPLGIPIFAHIDAVHGTGHAPGTTILPHNIGVGAAYMGDFLDHIGATTLADIDAWDMTDGADWVPESNLARDAGRVTAFEMAALGYHFTFSPCIPLALDMRWGRTSEGFGQNPHFEGIVAAQVVEGYQGGQAPVNHAMLDTGEIGNSNPFHFLAGPFAMGSTMKHYLGEGICVNGANQGQLWVNELLPSHPDFAGVSWPIARNRGANGRPTGTGGGNNFDPQGVFDLNFMSREDWWAEDDIRDIIETYRHLIESGARSMMPTFNSVNGLRVHQLQSVTDIVTRPIGQDLPGLPWFNSAGARLNRDGTVMANESTYDTGETLGFTGFLVGDFNGHTNGTFAPTGATLTQAANIFYPVAVNGTNVYNIDGNPYLGAFNYNNSSITQAQFRNGLVINAGMDLMMVVGNHEGRVPATGAINLDAGTSWFNTQMMNVLSHRVSLDRLYDANARILRVKFELGLFDNPFPNMGLDAAGMRDVIGGDGTLTGATWRDNATYMAALNEAIAYSDTMLRAGLDIFEGDNFFEANLGIETPGITELPDVARQTARESLVLLKNEVPAAPIATGATGTIMEQLLEVDPEGILVAGRFANRIGWQLGDWNRTWQGETHPLWGQATITLPGATGITPIAPPAGINAAAGHYIGSNLLEGMHSVLDGFNPVTQFSEFGLPIATMPAADVDVIILAVGETPYSEGNGDAGLEATIQNNNNNSRGHASNLQLHPEDHVILRQVQANFPDTPIVMVGYFGRPMTMENIIGDVDAFICAWWPGTEGGIAVAEMLFTDEFEFVGRTAFPWAWYTEWIGRTTVTNSAANLWNLGAGLNRDERSNALTPNTFERPVRQTTPIAINLTDDSYIDGFIYTHSPETNERLYRQPVFDRGGYLASTRIRTGGNLNHGTDALPVIGVTTMANPLTFFAGEMAWVEYLVHVQDAGDYLAVFETNNRTGPVASNALRLSTKAVDADRDDSGTLLGTFTVGASIASQVVTLAAGQQVLRIEIDPTATGLDINTIRFEDAVGHFDLSVNRATFAAGDTRMISGYAAELIVTSVSAQEGDVANLVLRSGAADTGTDTIVVSAPFVYVDGEWVAVLTLPDAGVEPTVTTGGVAGQRRYRVTATRPSGTGPLNEIDVTALAWTQDIFEMRVEGRSNQVHGVFSADTAIALGATSGTMCGTLAGGLQTSPIGVRENLITGFQTDDIDLLGGEPIIFMNGVQFPALFGSTEFSFTAPWRIGEERVTLTVVDGVKTPNLASHVVGTQVTLTTTVPENYEFIRWNIEPTTAVSFVSGSSATTNPATIIMPAANLTITAVTSQFPQQVIFDWNYDGAPNNGVFARAAIAANGSVGARLDAPGTAIGAVTNANAPVRAGYTFAGWFRYADPGTGQHNAVAGPAGTFTPAQQETGVRVFAHWIPDDHVRYITVVDANGDELVTLGTSVFAGQIIDENGNVIDIDNLPGFEMRTMTAEATNAARPDGVSTRAGFATVNFPVFRDLNRDGVLDPYEDWRLSDEERIADLASRMSVQEVAGLMLFSGHQTAWFPNAANRQDPTNPTYAQSVFLANDDLRHVLIAGTGNFGDAHAGWNNNTQAMSESFGLGIPNNNSSDPRHSPAIGVEFYSDNLGTMSLWPTTLGLAATMCPETVLHFSKVAGAEYRAFGISTALHPHIDIATDTRWTRYSGTFGEDPRLSAELARVYTIGWQGTFDGDFDDFDDMTGHWGRHSVNAMMKHWTGGAPTESGRDAHNEFGAYGIFPGGYFEAHLAPFVYGGLQPATGQADPSIGVVTAVMPYYSINNNIDPRGLDASIAFSDFFLEDMLRDTFGFSGVICTDWQVDGARGFGPSVDMLTRAERSELLIRAGVNQFGGANTTAFIMEAYGNSDDPTAFEAMMQGSVQPLLHNVFITGLMENPFTCPVYAFDLGHNQDNFDAGYDAQIRSTVLLKNSNDLLPLAENTRVYIPHRGTGANRSLAFVQAHEFGFEVVSDPTLADVAIVPVGSPFMSSGAFGGGWHNSAGYVPLTNQFSQYTAVHARPISYAGDWRNFNAQPGGANFGNRILNRSYRNFTSQAENIADLRLLLDVAEAVGPYVPIITVMNVDNPSVMTEIDHVSDAVIIRFAASDAAVLEVISGNHAPSGLLPFQKPANMRVVEAQNEDQPRSFVGDEIFTDADGNTYDFAFGLTWNADGETVVIDDARVAHFGRTPVKYLADLDDTLPTSGLEEVANIYTMSLPWGIVDQPFSATLDATPGATVTFVGRIVGVEADGSTPIIDNTLPAGLIFTPGNRTISGIPGEVTSSTQWNGIGSGGSTAAHTLSADATINAMGWRGILGQQLLFNVSHPTLGTRYNYRLTLVITGEQHAYLTLPDPNDMSIARTLASRQLEENWTPESWAPFAEARAAVAELFEPMVPVGGQGSNTHGYANHASRHAIIENLQRLMREHGSLEAAQAVIDEATQELMDTMEALVRYPGPDLRPFALNVDVLEWGSAVTALVIDMGHEVTAAELADMDIEVSAVLRDPRAAAAATPIFNGTREVVATYLSTTGELEHTLIRRDEETPVVVAGNYIVVELRYGFNNTNAQVNGSNASLWTFATQSNYWLNLNYSVTIDDAVGVQADIVRPLYDDFAMVAFNDQQYRVFIPESDEPLPLVLWSHGHGERFTSQAGGNQGAQLFANMGGIGWMLNAPEDAVILAPQRGYSGYTRDGVIAYIEYLIQEGIVDADRIYASGPSAGAAESQLFMRENPDFFAAAALICPAGGGAELTVEQAELLAHIPIWYIQAEAGPGHNHDSSRVNHERLQAAGAADVRITIFDQVFGTELPNEWFVDGEGDPRQFYPDRHWSWIILLNDDVGNENTVINEGSVYDTTFMTWLFAQPVVGPIEPDVEIEVEVEDGNITVTVDPDGNHTISTDGNGNIVITLPDADPDDDISISLPDNWASTPDTDGAGNVIVTITPPAGYEVVEYPADSGNLIVRPVDLGTLNTEALEALIEHVGGLDATAYTPETWANLQEALAAAEYALVNAITQGEIDTAYANLRAAIDGLQLIAPPIVNRDALRDTLAEAAELEEQGDHSDASWAAFVAARDAAQAVYDNQAATQADVDAANEALRAAMNALAEFHTAYMFGNPYGYFLPRANISRAEVAAILARTMIDGFEAGELPEGMTSFTAFSDVSAANWFYYYVAWAYTEGLVQGDGEGRFLPRDYITREQLAAMLARTIEYAEAAGTMPFTDVGSISGWAGNYVYTAFSEGWMVGDEQSRFRPRANIMRAEVATAVNRILGRIDSRDVRASLHEDGALMHEYRARTFPDVAGGAWYFASVLGAANNHYLTRDGDEAINWKYVHWPQ
ncbi:MAG: glycoside hydrolase family 3 C-terminal domain-containing protein [Oscillospiraceae bacterium]|nr:glycoside hydrolase family 3 C-terminal domain-containing protein [Oscillospiraceae bacterium]